MTAFYHVAQLPLFGQTKVCTLCHVEKPLDEFRKRGPGRGGKPHSWCIACANEWRREKRHRNLENPPERKPIASIICKQCQIEKPISEFYADPLNTRGYRATCKDCVDKNDTRTANRGRRRKVWSFPPAAPGHKWCLKCEQEKSLDEFTLLNNSPDGHFAWCRDCHSVHRKARWPQIRDEVLRQNHEHYQSISDEERERRNAYNRKNSKKPQALLKNREKKRRREAAYQGHKVDYQAILDRDGYTCYICDKAIDGTLKKPDPARLTFDHVIPINPRPGEPKGLHEASNIKPCHYVCNCRKGNKPLETLTLRQRRGPDV